MSQIINPQQAQMASEAEPAEILVAIHKRIVDIMNSTSKTVDALMKLDMPAGVDIEIKT